LNYLNYLIQSVISRLEKEAKNFVTEMELNMKTVVETVDVVETETCCGGRTTCCREQQVRDLAYQL